MIGYASLVWLVSFTTYTATLRHFILIFLLFSFPAGAQTLQGVVTDTLTGKPLYPVTVVNKTTQAITYTNEAGYYTIAAKPGNMVTFSYMGYMTVYKATPNSIMVGTLNITMDQAAFQLPEYRLRQSSRTQYQIDSAERRSIYHFELERKHPSPVNSPFSAVAEKFSKKAQRTYKFQKSYEEREEQRFIDTRYTPDLVSSVTGLTGDSIGHFMYAYPMPYDFAHSASALEIKMWIRNNYKLWMKNPQENNQ